ncbi:hypothetical protein J1614_005015, partial [Plenodomus biglobosus]
MVNSTVETLGWAPEPVGRGTIGLLWSCFATIFLCTWSAIHPNLPAMGENHWTTIRRRMEYVVGALCFPEYCALRIPICSQHKQGNYAIRPKFKCTLKQAFFVTMGGVVLKDVSETDTPAVRLATRSLIKLLKEDKLTSDIDDRSKSDWLVKSIAFAQILWFLVQITGRAVNRMSVTTLELFTLANVCCGTIIYAAWWKKPFDIRTPVILRVERLREEVVAVANRVPLTGDEREGGLTGKNSFAVFIMTSGLLGGLHILGWDFYFSSQLERWLWRVSSVTCTLVMVTWCIGQRIISITEDSEVSRFDMISAAVYALARLYMFVEMFLGLRSVPRDVYQTVQWSQYFPAWG